jgi:DNA-binding transcriptional ArsR family regulator
LGVDSRIRIIELLKQRGPLGVNEMAKSLGITPSAVSQHLKILKHAGLVRNERKGYWIPYQIDPVALKECGEFLAKICTCGCKGTGRVSEAELDGSEDKVDLLRKYEKELQEELQRVKTRIEELGKE